MPASFPELEYQQWLVLRLVNEKIRISTSNIAHHLYQKSSAMGRVDQICEQLWDLGLLINCGQYQAYRWECTDFGNDYCEEAIKPSPPLRP